MDDQQRVFVSDNDKVFNADKRHKFARAEDVVVCGVKRQVAVGIGDVAVWVSTQARVVLVLGRGEAHEPRFVQLNSAGMQIEV